MTDAAGKRLKNERWCGLYTRLAFPLLGHEGVEVRHWLVSATTKLTKPSTPNRLNINQARSHFIEFLSVTIGLGINAHVELQWPGVVNIAQNREASRCVAGQQAPR